MPEFAPRAKETSRGRHPDFDENGELRDDVDLPRGEREWRRMWANQAERAAFMTRLSHQQSQLPLEVQETVAGNEFTGYGSHDPYWGWREYETTIVNQRSFNPGEVTGADIEKMDLATYDQFFDERGQPRPGVTYSPTSRRDVDVSDRGSGMDPFSRNEMRGGH